MTVYAQFTREFKPSLFGRAIVWFTGAPFSHARLVFQDETGKWKVFHAIEQGVVVEDYVHGQEIIVASFPCELSCTLDHFEGIIYGSRGKKYSWIQCFLMGLGIYIPWNGDSRSVCSETQGIILRDYFGLKLSGDQDSWSPRNNYAALVDCFLERGLAYARYPR